MWPLGIVAGEPVRSDGADLRQGAEEVGVEDFGAIRLVKALDERVLGRLAGLDEVEPDTMRLGPRRLKNRSPICGSRAKRLKGD